MGKVGEKPTFLFPGAGKRMPAAENTVLTDHVTQLGERAATGTPIEIVEVQIRGAGKGRLVRVYIDKPGGITHGDCELISAKLGQLLDEEEEAAAGTPLKPAFIEGYTLEVSSPGVERRLSKPRDFEKAVGQKIKLTTLEPVAGRTILEGKLEQVADGNLDVEIAPGNLVHIPLHQVRKANLKFEW
jgi:ribosome maturation factor RimP